MVIKEMFINEEDGESGVYAMGIVSSPAIELDFIHLKEQQKKVQLAEVDGEKRILMGAALTPNKPIYRNQGGEEFYIYFSSATVRKASELFLKRGKQSETTEEHEIQLNGNTVVESWIKEDETHDKSVKFGLDAPIGTWFISMKIEDDEIWEKAKKGELNGFSIEAYFADKLEASKQTAPEDVLGQIMEVLKQV